MSVAIADLDDKLRHVINWAKGGGLTVAQITTEFDNMIAGLGVDSTTRDLTVQAPPPYLIPQSPPSKAPPAVP